MVPIYRNIICAFALALLTLTSGVAVRAEYIVGSYVLCRADPAETGTVLAYLTSGDLVSVVEKKKKWTKIMKLKAADWTPCWVERKEVRAPTPYEEAVGHVDAAIARPQFNPSPAEVEAMSPPSASTTPSYQPPVSYTPKAASKPVAPTTMKRGSKKARKPAVRPYTPAGYCPCSSGNICIGPRGGRYCITSGGNKRYGV